MMRHVACAAALGALLTGCFLPTDTWRCRSDADCLGLIGPHTCQTNECTPVGGGGSTSASGGKGSGSTRGSTSSSSSGSSSGQVAPDGGVDRPHITESIPASPANTATIVLRGFTQPGARVALHQGDACQGQALGDDIPSNIFSGFFEFTAIPVTRNAMSTFTVASLDRSGSPACSDPLDFTEDSERPQPPTLSRSGPEHATVAMVTLTITGEPGTTAALVPSADCTGTPLQSVSIPSGGSLERTLSVAANAAHDFSVQLTDAAGNVSDCSAPVRYVMDTTAPSTSAAMVFDGSASDELIATASTNAVSAEWTGFTDALSPITFEHALASDGACSALVAPAITATSPVQRTELTLDEQPYFNCVRAVDAAGNASAFVASNGFRVDLTPPDATGAVVHDGTGPDAAFLNLADRLLANWSFSLSEPVTFEARLSSDGTCVDALGDTTSTAETMVDAPLGTTLVSGSGYWHCVRAVDEAGHHSAWVASNGFVLDTVPPSNPPVVHDGTFDDGDLTNDPTRLTAFWFGSSDALSGVTAYELAHDTSSFCTNPVDTQRFTMAPATLENLVLADGRHHSCVRSVDAAGNVSTWTASDGITVDATSPTVVQTVPDNGATGVEVDVGATDLVGITFSEPVDAATVTTSTVVVRLSTGETVPGSWEVDREVATFRPSAGFRAPVTTEATVQATSGVTDVAGNALVPHTWVFHFRDRAWDASATALRQTCAGLRIVSSGDANGWTHTAVVEDASEALIAYTRPASGGAWSESFLMELRNLAHASWDVATGGADVMVAWSGIPFASTSHRIQVVTGPAWSVPDTAVSTNLAEAPGRLDPVRLAVSPNGTRMLLTWSLEVGTCPGTGCTLEGIRFNGSSWADSDTLDTSRPLVWDALIHDDGTVLGVVLDSNGSRAIRWQLGSAINNAWGSDVPPLLRGEGAFRSRVLMSDDFSDAIIARDLANTNNPPVSACPSPDFTLPDEVVIGGTGTVFGGACRRDGQVQLFVLEPVRETQTVGANATAMAAAGSDDRVSVAFIDGGKVFLATRTLGAFGAVEEVDATSDALEVRLAVFPEPGVGTRTAVIIRGANGLRAATRIDGVSSWQHTVLATGSRTPTVLALSATRDGHLATAWCDSSGAFAAALR